MSDMAEKWRIGLVGVFDFDFLAADVLLRIVFDELQRRLGDEVGIEVLSPYGDSIGRRWPSFEPIFALGQFSPGRADQLASRFDAMVLAPGIRKLTELAAPDYAVRPIGAEPADATEFLALGADPWVERGLPVIDIAHDLDLLETLWLTPRCFDQSTLATTVDLLIGSGDLPNGPVVLAIDTSEQPDSWWEEIVTTCDDMGATLSAANSDGSESSVGVHGVVALPAMVDSSRLLAVVGSTDLVITDDDTVARVVESMGVAAIPTSMITNLRSGESKRVPLSADVSAKKRHDLDLTFDQLAARVSDAIHQSPASRQSTHADAADLSERIDELTALTRTLQERLGQERALMGRKFIDQRRVLDDLNASVGELMPEVKELRWRLASSAAAIRDLQTTRELATPTTKSTSRLRRALRKPRTAICNFWGKFRRADR